MNIDETRNANFPHGDYAFMRHVQMKASSVPAEPHPCSIEVLEEVLGLLLTRIPPEVPIVIAHSNKDQAVQTARLAHKTIKTSGRAAPKIRCRDWIGEMLDRDKEGTQEEIDELRAKFSGQFILFISHQHDIAGQADVELDTVRNCTVFHQEFCITDVPGFFRS